MDGVMFTLTSVDGERSLSYHDDGTITSQPPELVDVLNSLAQRLEGHAVGPLNGPYTVKNHLKSPYSAWVLFSKVIGWGYTMTGKLPMRPPVPPGAIP